MSKRRMYFIFGEPIVPGEERCTLHVTLTAPEADRMALQLLEAVAQARKENRAKPPHERETPVIGVTFRGSGVSRRRRSKS